MTFDEWLTIAKTRWIAPPASMRNADGVALVIERGMNCIRQDLREARQLANVALRLARLVQDPRQLGSAERLLGHTFLLAGKAQKALRHYERALEAFDALPEERAATATAMLQALAYVGDYSRAFEVASEAMDYYAGQGDEFHAARIEANLANAKHRLDRFEEASKHYERALRVLAASGATADHAIVLRNYGVCLMGMRQFDRADEVYTQARAHFEHEGYESLLLEIDLNRAYLLGRRGLIRDSLQMYRRLRLNLPQDLGFEIGHCFLDQADLMLEVGLWTDARQAAESARQVFQSLGSYFELGKASLMKALACLRLHQVDEATLLLREARRRLMREPNRTWHALVAFGEAERLELLGKPSRALEALIRAESEPVSERTPMIRRRLVDLALDLGQWDVATAHLDPSEHPALMAKYLRLTNREAEASKLAIEALHRYDLERRSHGPLGLRKAIAAAHDSNLRECFRSLRDPLERLAVVVRLKNQSLAEIAASPESLPEGDALRQLRSQVFMGTSQDTSAEIAIDRLITEYSTIDQVIANRSVSFSDLSSNEWFVDLFVDQGRLLAFCVRGRDVEEVDLGAVDDFARMSTFLRFHLGRDRRTGGEHSLTALDWFGKQLEPVLDGAPSHIFIGREPLLAGVPLAACRVRKEFAYLLHNLVFAPSLSVWQAVRSRPPGGGKGVALAGAADEVAPEIESELSALERRLRTRRLSNLRDFEAKLSSSAIVHIASHSVHREDRPLFSSMRIGDQEWTVLDVLRCKMVADLVTLSGCDTALSSHHDASVADGFIEAFLAVGARSVLASHWDISDEATFHWMDAFYEAFSNKSATESYREAIESTRRCWDHPVFWAAFSLNGAGVH